MVLAEDVLDSLRQGEGLAGAIGPNDEDRRQKNGDGCGDGQNGFFLLCIQTRIQLLIPLPEDTAGNEKLLIKVLGCSFYIRKLSHSVKPAKLSVTVMTGGGVIVIDKFAALNPMCDTFFLEFLQNELSHQPVAYRVKF